MPIWKRNRASSRRCRRSSSSASSRFRLPIVRHRTSSPCSAADPGTGDPPSKTPAGRFARRGFLHEIADISVLVVFVLVLRGRAQRAQLAEDGVGVDFLFLFALVARGQAFGFLRRLQRRAEFGGGRQRPALGGLFHFHVEIDLAAEAERHRIHRREVGGVPVGALADLLDRRFRRADEAGNLRVLQFRMVANEPEDGVRAVLTLGNRGVTRAAALGFRHPHLRFGQLELVVRIGFGAGDFVAGKLTGRNRIEALDALRRFAIGNRLDLERVKFAELRDLIERQRRVVDKPDGGRLRHEQCLSHGYSPSIVRAGRGPWIVTTMSGKYAAI
ncbi:flagellin C protein [Rhizobium etli CNPAF512]|nr:flagellin C protein [Rhizobium etli CNPAF512]